MLADTCPRCNKRLGFVFGLRGFGWRQRGHESRCLRRALRKGLASEVGTDVATSATPMIASGVVEESSVITTQIEDYDDAQSVADAKIGMTELTEIITSGIDPDATQRLDIAGVESSVPDVAASEASPSDPSISISTSDPSVSDPSVVFAPLVPEELQGEETAVDAAPAEVAASAAEECQRFVDYVASWNAMQADHGGYDGWHDDNWANQWMQSSPWADWREPWNDLGSHASFPGTIALRSDVSLPSTGAMEQSGCHSHICANPSESDPCVDTATPVIATEDSSIDSTNQDVEETVDQQEKVSSQAQTSVKNNLRKKKNRFGRKHKQKNGQWRELSAGGC